MKNRLLDTATDYIAYIKKPMSATRVRMMLLSAIIFVWSCDLPPKEKFEKRFPKNENLIAANAVLGDPETKHEGKLHGIKVKYEKDTIHVKFKFNGGTAHVEHAIGYKGDTLFLYYYLWCEVCMTEWTGYGLEYKILNKRRKKYKVIPVQVNSEDFNN